LNQILYAEFPFVMT